MAINRELTRDKIVNDVPLMCFELTQLILDDKVSSGKTKMTALKALVDELNTSIQAVSSSFTELT